LEVHKAYRGQGLSQKMYKILNEWVQENTIIIGGGMTLEGTKRTSTKNETFFLLDVRLLIFDESILKL
jgi:hypothetical protein